jgi:uncharacterized membrane protein (DUF2068 family)
VIVLISMSSVLVTLLAMAAIPSLMPLADRLSAFGQFTPYDIANTLLMPFQLILAFGLWYLRRWAWTLYMMRLGMSMIINLQAHFAGAADVNYIYMAMDVVIVFYLNQRDVQRAFGYEAPEMPEEDILT